MSAQSRAMQTGAASISARGWLWRRQCVYRSEARATSSTSPAGPCRYDAIVIGGGHNGLVAAARLADAGQRVAVLERRGVLGGAAVTEEIVPGFKFSRASYVYSLFRPRIVRDFDLLRHGLQLLPRVPSSFTPSPEVGGKYLVLGAGSESDLAEIGKFSVRDAQAYPAYCQLLERYCSVLRPMLDRAPPDPGLLWPGSGAPAWAVMENLQDAAFFGARLAALGPDAPGLLEVLTVPASRILDRWFEADVLKATLATDSVIGALSSPSTPGSAYVLLHHVMCGAWSNVRGGMGALSLAIASAARHRGADIRVNSPVRKLITEGAWGEGDSGRARVRGVELEDGTVLEADRVLSTAAPSLLFGPLLGGEAEAERLLPAGFLACIRSADVRSGSAKINLALDHLPQFRCLGPASSEPGEAPHPALRGTIHFELNREQIEVAYRDALGGRPSRRPIIEMTLPSVLDDSLAPSGKHVASLFVQYAPYNIAGGWDSRTADGRTAREMFAESVFDVIEEFAPGFKASIIGQEVLTPIDLERIFALPGGNIFQAAMGLDQLFWLRPGAGYARYRSPIQGLYVAGAGAHPGGGVMGSPGDNAAAACLRDIERSWRRWP